MTVEQPTADGQTVQGPPVQSPTVAEPVLGIDCGGGSTRGVLVLADGRQERLDGPPLNVLLHADLVDVVADLVARSGAARAGVGVPGLRGDERVAELSARLTARCGVPVVAAGDVEVARLAAFAGAPGIVVIAGTGSNALGEDVQGRQARAGGHGFLLGDEGGGWWIGRAAVNAALRAADGTGPETALVDMVVRLFGGLDDAVATVHRSPSERTLLSHLTRDVASCAAEGDPVAGAILDHAAEELAALAAAVRARLDAGRIDAGRIDTALPVAMLGGVFAIDRVRSRMVEATGAVAPLEPPELGAVRLALRATGAVDATGDPR